MTGANLFSKAILGLAILVGGAVVCHAGDPNDVMRIIAYGDDGNRNADEAVSMVKCASLLKTGSYRNAGQLYGVEANFANLGVESGVSSGMWTTDMAENQCTAFTAMFDEAAQPGFVQSIKFAWHKNRKMIIKGYSGDVADGCPDDAKVMCETFDFSSPKKYDGTPPMGACVDIDYDPTVGRWNNDNQGFNENKITAISVDFIFQYGNNKADQSVGTTFFDSWTDDDGLTCAEPIIATPAMEEAARGTGLFALIKLKYESPATKILSEAQLARVHKALERSLARKASGKYGARLDLFIKLGVIPYKRRLLESGTIDITLIPAAGEDELPTTTEGMDDLKQDLADLVFDTEMEAEFRKDDVMNGFSLLVVDDAYF